MKKKSLAAAWAAAIVAGTLTLVVALSWSEVAGPGLLILTYHRVVSDTVPASAYKVPVSAFARQLDFLREQGYTFVDPDHLAGGGGSAGAKQVLITFDDGTDDHASTVVEQLEERGIKGVFFVMVGGIDKPGFLSREGLLRLAERGQGIGSHSLTHRYMDELDGAELERELLLSKVTLEGILGRPVVVFAPPGGWFDRETERVARAVGYRYLFSCLIGVNPPDAGDFVYRRVSVPGTVTLEGFGRLVSRGGLLRQRVVQRLKYVVHDLIGSTRYVAFSDWARREAAP